MIIASAAYFDVCVCGEHGSIRTSKGGITRKIRSKYDARGILQILLERGDVCSEEAKHIRMQIDDSTLPQTYGDIEKPVAPEIYEDELPPKDPMQDLFVGVSPTQH